MVIARPIKVMYVIATMGSGRAGTEKNLLTIISHLDRSQFEPRLVCLQDGPFVRDGPHVCPTSTLDVCRMFTPRMWKRWRDLAKQMRDLRIDIVQTFTTDAHLVGGGAARTAGVPVIISSRRDLGFAYGAKEKLFLRLANRYPHRILANSHAVAESIAELERIDRSRIDVIHNGVEMAARGPSSHRDSASVVMVANLRPVKSIPTFIRAAADVVKVKPGARFTLVGDGPERATLEKMVRESGLGDRFCFVGSQEDVFPFLSRASVGVLTSKSEGFSNAILEYMCAGLPVVATDAGGNAEIVEDSETGYLFPVSDHRALAKKLIYLLEDSSLARRMGEQGRARVASRFSLEAMIRQHQGYYRKLCAPGIGHL